jgi:hypothetical protein
MPPAAPVSPIRTICCIGAGYVGGPTMAVIAVLKTLVPQASSIAAEQVLA